MEFEVEAIEDYGTWTIFFSSEVFFEIFDSASVQKNFSELKF